MDRKKLGMILTAIFFIGAGLMVGMTQGALFFSDYGAGETVYTRIVISVSIALISGVLFGFFLSRIWWLSITAVWMPVFFTVLDVMRMAKGEGASDGELLFVMRLFPVATVLLASYFGAWAKRPQRFKLVFFAVALGIIGIGGSALFL
jgi:hypothetical protein